MPSYHDFFQLFDGHEPFNFQIRFHESGSIFKILDVATGLGKTQTVLADWLYRRPTRRLVYCLPGRTLTKQICSVARAMVATANLTAEVKVIELMGDSGDLDIKLSPSEYAILVGTQDILISRALNRGYASNPFRWPMDFALLNNDAAWIFDEVQLLGDALATSSQLAGFRRRFGVFGRCPSVWMSATFDHSWLKTVDFQHEEPEVITLTAVDLANAEINKRLTAAKSIQRAEECETTKGCAEFVREKHKQGTLSLIVTNTVRRAQEIWEHLHKLRLTQSRLLHSRFRPADRVKATEEILSLKDAIVVATQVIEAGVRIWTPNS